MFNLIYARCSNIEFRMRDRSHSDSIASGQNSVWMQSMSRDWMTQDTPVYAGRMEFQFQESNQQIRTVNKLLVMPVAHLLSNVHAELSNGTTLM